MIFVQFTKNPPKAVKLSGDFRSYEFRVMNLASPNVMGVLRTRYDMIALLHQTAPKVHHNYAKRIITDNLPKAIIVEFCVAKLTPIRS